MVPRSQIFALLIMLGGSSGCAQHVALIKTFDNRTVEVTWKRLDGYHLARMCGDRAAGCARFQLDGEQRCVIYAPEPQGIDDDFGLRVLGEELLHCFYGEVHEDSARSHAPLPGKVPQVKPPAEATRATGEAG